MSERVSGLLSDSGKLSSRSAFGLFPKNIPCRLPANEIHLNHDLKSSIVASARTGRCDRQLCFPFGQALACSRRRLATENDDARGPCANSCVGEQPSHTPGTGACQEIAKHLLKEKQIGMNARRIPTHLRGTEPVIPSGIPEDKRKRHNAHTFLASGRTRTWSLLPQKAQRTCPRF